MFLKNKKFLVFGLGKSGISSIEFLIKNKAKVYVYDDNNLKLLEILNRFPHVEVLEYQTENSLKKINYIVVSPGVKPNHNIISIAKFLGIKIITEVELASFFDKSFFIGVTGSNGKTTTTTFIDKFLNTKYNSIACGNIGIPLCDTLSQNYNIKAIEMSSFQLEYINKLNFKISIITNISPNHLNWHFNFNEYVKAKQNIYKNSKKNDILILNADDKNIIKLNLNNLKSKVLFFSTRKECFGIYVKNDKIVLNIENAEEICTLKDVKILGEHNLSNVLASILCAKLLNVKNKDIKDVLNNFYGIEHRIEKFYEFENTICINDSKSTSIESTLCAISALKKYNIILLLGGSNKNLNYDNLAKKIPQNVKNVFVFGQVKNDIAESLNKFNKPYIICENINEAIFNSVSCCKALSIVNDSVAQRNFNKNAILFSPASASFDSFNSFEERGIYFKEYLKSTVEDLYS